jgi:hypothetical protein
VNRSALRPLIIALLAAACAAPAVAQRPPAPSARPDPDPRVGLRPGLFDAGEAAWNLQLVATSPPPREFVGVMNSDLAFTGSYVIQGNFNGFAVWDIAEPARPVLVKTFVCPASQSDVSVYRNLLFVSGEDFGARLDCGTQGVREPVSPQRFRGIRIFDISDVRNPRYITNVQTCRGSHTHSVLEHPGDTANVYIYVSGSAPVRPDAELPGCRTGPPEDTASALFRIEVIRVPLSRPEQAAVVNSPRIFQDLAAPPMHGTAPADSADLAAARVRGAFVLDAPGEAVVIPDDFADRLLADIVRGRSGTGAPTAADSAALRDALRQQATAMASQGEGARTGPNQCHDITLAPALGLAGGACEGYGLLLDIRDPVNPRRLDAVADSNFAYWHSATLNNDGTSILFSDEWGGGAGPKCRASDPRAWGADAIFRIRDGRMQFAGYYKLPAPQTSQENCVAHNGSLIPIPGRDVMAQAWYQGGISVFDWTDPANPVEIAFHDRGPVDSTRMVMGGSWSVYWYNGVLVSSEIARGLDILELQPSAFLSVNEIAAARSVRLEYLNTQGQLRFTWPPSFALARAWVDQLERARTLGADRIAALRRELDRAERDSGSARRNRLNRLAAGLDRDAAARAEAARVRRLAATVRELATN